METFGLFIWWTIVPHPQAAVAQGGDIGRIAAALELQRVWRGQKTRRKLTALISGLTFETRPKQRQSHFAHIYPRYKQYVRRCAKQGLPPDVVLRFRDYCARVIQLWWRAVNKHRPKWSLQKAVVVIQRAWRRHRDVKLYRFYRDLVMFHARGNPSHLLRTINPLEAELLDKAAGSFVRFRLGGETFPPNIYYKIFVHHNVVDMCAYSPRDYTAMASRWQVARDVNNKNPRVTDDGGKENWYQRWENNGWRPVSIRLFGVTYDAVTAETASKRKGFHHSKLQRQRDLERRKKQRKIEWLQKMYREGSLQTRASVDAKTDRPMHSHEAEGLDEDGDVDKLLSWSNSLDFEG